MPTLSDLYVSVNDYRTSPDSAPNDSGAGTDIERDIRAIQSFLNNALGRPAGFAQENTPTPWLYMPELNRYGDSPIHLWVDDIALLAGVEIKVDDDNDGVFTGDTAWALTDYELLPRNAPNLPVPSAWNQVRIRTGSTKSSFPAGKLVQVTAVHGWPAVPPAIQSATVALTGILRLEDPRATRTVSAVGEVMGTSPTAQKVLQALVREYKWRAHP